MLFAQHFDTFGFAHSFIFFFTFLLHRFPADISDVDCEVQHREAIHSVKGDLSAP